MSAELSDRIRTARASGIALRIVGAGTWLDAGRPCTAADRLELGSLSGVMRYEPGDFVLTARAGTPLEDIERVAAQHGQWLTLDPVGDQHGTIGATIATGSSGALATAFGTPRDHVLGCEFVTGAGDVIRAGGQVVKNVAGFDLVRLVTGAWGTLGVLTEVTLRMRARPEVDATVAIALTSHPARALWQWLRKSEFSPLAAELLSPELSNHLGLGDQATALVRSGGNEPLVRAALVSLGELGELRTLPVDIWDQWRRAFAASPITYRLSALPSHISELWEHASARTKHSGIASASVARGMVRCAMTNAESDLGQVTGTGMSCVFERLPNDLWPSVTSPRNTKTLDERVRKTYDPDAVLNPGILDT